jgi:hypothetical protein
MDDITNIDAQLGRPHKTGADHYRTADMHRACALANLRGASSPSDDDADKPDLWSITERFEQHMRLAELHARLAEARIGAVQLLQQHLAIDDHGTQRQRMAIEAELTAWADAIAPL